MTSKSARVSTLQRCAAPTRERQRAADRDCARGAGPHRRARRRQGVDIAGRRRIGCWQRPPLSKSAPPRRTDACRSSACRSRSRTTSTSPACRPPRPVPASPTGRGTVGPGRRAADRMPARCSIGKTNLDQFATGLVGTRSPYGVPSNPFDPAYHSGRLELGLGGRGRHRARVHSRSAPTRRARAACRPASTTSSG